MDQRPQGKAQRPLKLVKKKRVWSTLQGTHIAKDLLNRTLTAQKIRV